jgi:hypothetical protein
MARYLISFPDGAMGHIPDEDWTAVGEAAHAVVEEAKAAGVWIHGGGLLHATEVSIVSPEGTLREGPDVQTGPPVGGFALVDVATRDEALAWATKIAVGCRCPQEVRELMPDENA